MGELKIRRYQESDYEAVLDMYVKGLMQVGSYVGEGPWDEDMRHIVEHYLQDEGEFLVGEYEGQVVAMGAFRKTGEHEAEIKRMRTNIDFQGKGFGQQIYSALEAKAREMGYTRLHLDTGLYLYPAQQLYLKNGYVEIRRADVHMGLPAIFYEKILS